ncbi:MAG: helix-turn-helix domain-containing protein [Proteobacteria bacterium]|nr:helix-turn-helix domain-containing protein [Pseudomonadota bacterium]
MAFDPAKATQLNTAIAALRTSGVVPVVAGRLREGSEAISRQLREVVIQEISAFTASANPDVLPELEQDLALHVKEICQLLGGRPAGDLAFVAEHARRRAEQKFPLDAILRSYKCAHRILSDWIRDAALQAAHESAQVRRVVAAVTDFTVEYLGLVSSLTTTEYVSHTRQLAEAEGGRRSKLLNMLLHGYDESDNRATQLLRRAGYLEQRQSFCVVVARSVDPREMENAARAQRMLESFNELLHSLPIRSLISVRDKLVTIVLSGTRRLSGWTAAQSLLADRVYPQLRKIGTAALIGISADAPSTSHIPRALSEARLALDFASVSERVMPYARIPFRHILVRAAADNIQSALPHWLDDLLRADKKARGTLINTLQAYADADMNVLQTGKAMGRHPNTIYARLERIEDITGKNALGYHALTELLLAIECAGRSQA